MRTIDLRGKKFGRLTVLRKTGFLISGNQRCILWSCLCVCGQRRRLRGDSLRAGLTKSCGCLNVERTRKMGRANTILARTHGHCSKGHYSPEYFSWRSMIQRCTNPKSRSWKNYGGRGIKICQRWLKFINFLSDMGTRPRGTTLDRINNNGNYKPPNCRWATWVQQNQNQRKRAA